MYFSIQVDPSKHLGYIFLSKILYNFEYMMLFLLIMVNPTLLATKRITTQHAFTKHYMLEQCMLTHN